MTKNFNTLKEWLDWQESFHPQVIDLGLDRVASVFATLIPEGVNVPVITVAGTNGKGSCIALLEAIYRAQGFSVGAYTSPHILCYNERIRINGESVSDELIIGAFARIEASRQNISLSYFEFSTLAALDIFCQAKLDVLLLEVGLGGRLDAVNIVHPDVAIISSIDIDHSDWLGDTREVIAIEKAGIFREGRPAIIGDPLPPLTLFEVAQQKNTPLLCINHEFIYQCGVQDWQWHCGNVHLVNLPFPGLKGSHQFRNASSVLAAINHLQMILQVTEAAIHEGLMSVQLTGRFQFINAAIPVLLDVGHNPQAVKTLFEYVTEVFPNKKIHAVFAMMKDKDIKGVIEIMSPLISDWSIAPLHNPRAASSEMMLEIFASCGVTNVVGNFGSFNKAVLHAEKKAKPNDLILVFGSFFLVSAYLSEFENDHAILESLVGEVGVLNEKNSINQVIGSAQDNCLVEVPCR